MYFVYIQIEIINIYKIKRWRENTGFRHLHLTSRKEIKLYLRSFISWARMSLRALKKSPTNKIFFPKSLFHNKLIKDRNKFKHLKMMS